MAMVAIISADTRTSNLVSFFMTSSLSAASALALIGIEDYGLKGLGTKSLDQATQPFHRDISSAPRYESPQACGGAIQRARALSIARVHG